MEIVLIILTIIMFLALLGLGRIGKRLEKAMADAVYFREEAKETYEKLKVKHEEVELTLKILRFQESQSKVKVN